MQEEATAPSDPHKEPRYVEYVQRFQALENLITEQRRALDTALLTLSAGAFGVSMLFVSLLEGPFIVPVVLFGAWLCFALVLVVGLLSYMAAIKAADDQQARLTKAYKQDVNPEPTPHRLVVRYLNFASLGLFVVGIGLLALFAWRNLT